MKKVLIILGPTGVGKSDMAVKIAQRFNGEIISADSVQVFRKFNIGSAKITNDEMQGVVHHCIDILPPDAEFSVFEYVEMTKRLINEILQRNHLPIIVGGTGLYVKALTLGYNFGGTGKQTEIRERLKKEAQEIGLEKLHQRLFILAPERAEKISVNDEKRIIRALELCEFGEKPSLEQVDLDAKIIGLICDREKLYSNINKRVESMIEKGLIKEVQSLLEDGLTSENQAMKAIGYKEVLKYLDKEISYDEMIELIKKNTRNYAKRQLTFCRGIEGLEFVDVEDRGKAEKEIISKVEEWL